MIAASVLSPCERRTGEQSLIISSRPANMVFEDSDPVKLATGQSFAALEVDDGLPVCIGGVDIQVAFYALQLPTELRRYFGLLPLRAEDAGVHSVDGRPAAAGEMVTPVLRVLPMGWTLALWTCQVLLEYIASTVHGIDDSNRLRDRRPAPPIHSEPREFIHTEYVDNIVALGVNLEAVEGRATAVKSALGQHGLPTHPVEGGVGGDTLGWHFAEDRPIVGVSLRSAWRLRLGLVELCRRGRCSGDELRSTIVHYTFRALMRRELLSCLSSCYAFVEVQGHRRGQLWPGVLRELKWCYSMLPLATRDLAAPWCGRVAVNDASWWGCGIMEKHAPVSVIREAALHSDRWRFQRDEELEVVWQEREGSMDERVEALSAAVIDGSEDAPGACEAGSRSGVGTRSWTARPIVTMNRRRLPPARSKIRSPHEHSQRRCQRSVLHSGEANGIGRCPGDGGRAKRRWCSRAGRLSSPYGGSFVGWGHTGLGT